MLLLVFLPERLIVIGLPAPLVCVYTELPLADSNPLKAYFTVVKKLLSFIEIILYPTDISLAAGDGL
jgi:hypothetical protein